VKLAATATDTEAARAGAAPSNNAAAEIAAKLRRRVIELNFGVTIRLPENLTYVSLGSV
jgi:hypothetical protein